MSIFAWIVKQLGFTGVAIIAIFAYYEGIPGASLIPGFSKFPIIGTLATGQVQQRIDAATAKMVTTFERDALAAQLAAEQRQRAVAEQLATDATKRASDALRAKMEASQKLEALIKADTEEGGAVWTQEDLNWLGR